MSDTTDRLQKINTRMETIQGAYLGYDDHIKLSWKCINDLIIVCANQQGEIRQLRADFDALMKSLNKKVIRGGTP